MNAQNDDHFPEDDYTVPGNHSDQPQWSEKNPPASGKPHAILAGLIVAVVVTSIAVGVAKFKAKKQAASFQRPGQLPGTGMGPLFNALGDEDRTTVLFGVLREVEARPGESYESLGTRLRILAENYSHPHMVDYMKHDYYVAMRGADKKDRTLAKAASDICQGKAPAQAQI